MPDRYSAQQLADEFGVALATIRTWQERGQIPAPEIREGGFRKPHRCYWSAAQVEEIRASRIQ